MDFFLSESCDWVESKFSMSKLTLFSAQCHLAHIKKRVNTAVLPFTLGNDLTLGYQVVSNTPHYSGVDSAVLEACSFS